MCKQNITPLKYIFPVNIEDYNFNLFRRAHLLANKKSASYLPPVTQFAFKFKLYEVAD